MGGDMFRYVPREMPKQLLRYGGAGWDVWKGRVLRGGAKKEGRLGGRGAGDEAEGAFLLEVKSAARGWRDPAELTGEVDDGGAD